MKGLNLIALVLVLGLVGLVWMHQAGDPTQVAVVPAAELEVAVPDVPAAEPAAEAAAEPVVEPPAPAPVAGEAAPVVEAPVAAPAPVVEAAAPVEVVPAPVVRVLVGRDQADAETLDADLEQAIENKGWVAYQKLLEDSLLGSFDRIGKGPEVDPYAEVWKQEVFYQALLRWQVLRVLPPSAWVAASDSSACAQLAGWLFKDNAAMEQVVMTVSDKDDVAQVLPMLVRLWGSHDEPELAPKYFNLALACAVVFDRKLAYREPGGAGGYHIDPERRYHWYVGMNQRGWLEVSIDRSPARDLAFVVCAPVTEAELDWAVREFRSTRRDGWGKTYGSVRYLMKRAVEGFNPYDAYTLEEILDEGGICGDQTYFCVNTARAAGIPALGLSGVTDSGGHAWAAVKVEPDAWSTTIGRIGGVSMGRGEDPQTGETITEQEIWMWSSRDHQSEARVMQVFRHLGLAGLMERGGRDEVAAGAVRSAFRTGKAFPAVWEGMYGVMSKDQRLRDDPKAAATVAAWDEFAQSIKREFKENPRMGALAVKVEDEHVFPYQQLNDVRRSLLRDRRRHGRNAAEQSDLVVATLKREARFLMEKDPEHAQREIGQLYDNALKDYGSSITGFQQMADDYFGMMKGDVELAAKAVRDIELAFQRVIETGTTDFFRAKAEVAIHQRICAMYREIGDEKRAKLLESRFERQMEKAKRKAL